MSEAATDDWITVCNVGEVEDGDHRVVDLDGTAVLVVRVGDGFFAIENVCTHDGGELTGGCVDAGTIACPRHGARFDLASGEALSAPAYEPVATFPVRIDNGMVFVRDNRWD